MSMVMSAVDDFWDQQNEIFFANGMKYCQTDRDCVERQGIYVE